MNPLRKKIFSLKDITYSWILIVSVLLFIVTMYLDLYNDPTSVQVLPMGSYLLAFLIAVLWGVLNYIGHIRINAMHQKYNDIQAFVSNLVLDNEEKLELQAYLEDFSRDLVSKGLSKHDSDKEAIQQFKVEEFNSLSKNTTLFNLHAHYYLWGYVCITLISFTCLFLFSEMVFLSSLIINVLIATFFCYGVGLGGMFFLYKLFDAMLYKNVHVEKGDL
ncbi:hypothetical protein [Pseudalkalibacillus decolorationis]|uniref:hypothetical protein n=1 Tax=Pseudalkalibacillus decolorationis TaxID=163879 RepID=UPI00214770C8|nr:hypothetical protein [Pseudalkalibacillus decolorationis]